ncbi:hypothetical protein KCU78_g22527, partial [Aureobasidium melanogenum]
KKDNEEKPFEKLDKKILKGQKGKFVSHLENGMGTKAKANAILAGGERSGGMDW